MSQDGEMPEPFSRNVDHQLVGHMLVDRSDPIKCGLLHFFTFLLLRT